MLQSRASEELDFAFDEDDLADDDDLAEDEEDFALDDELLPLEDDLPLDEDLPLEEEPAFPLELEEAFDEELDFLLELDDFFLDELEPSFSGDSIEDDVPSSSSTSGPEPESPPQEASKETARKATDENLMAEVKKFIQDPLIPTVAI